MGNIENKAYLKHQKEIVRNQWLSYDAFGGKSNFNKPKMLHLKHNFMKNYLNASGDNAQKADILTSEIAKLIVYNPRKMTGLINTYLGKNIVGIPSRGQLVKLTSQGIQDNKAFATAIANEIVVNKGFVNFNQTGGAPPPKVDYQKVLESGSKIVDFFGGLFGGKNKARAAAAATAQAQAEADRARAEAERARAEAQKSLAEKTAALSGGGTQNTLMYVGIVVGVVVIAGAAMYFFKK